MDIIKQVIEVAFEECCLPVRDFSVQDVADSNGVFTVLTYRAVVFHGGEDYVICVTVYLPSFDPCAEECPAWNGQVQVTTFTGAVMVPITALIDMLQGVKDSYCSEVST